MTSSNLAATDGTSNFGDVMFTVVNAPKSGIFALVDNMARPIKSFTQESRAIYSCVTEMKVHSRIKNDSTELKLDLMARRVVYVHTSKGKN